MGKSAYICEKKWIIGLMGRWFIDENHFNLIIF
jgi:hypothetical protein